MYIYHSQWIVVLTEGFNRRKRVVRRAGSGHQLSDAVLGTENANVSQKIKHGTHKWTHTQ